MMDGDERILLGKIDGKVEALLRAFEDERELRREESRANLLLREKVDDLEDKNKNLSVLVEQLQIQTYSNKTETDKIKVVTSKIVGIIAVLSLLGSLVLSGIYWVVTHPTEIVSFVKSLTAGKP